MARRKAYVTADTMQNIARNSFNMLNASFQWYEMMTASATTIGLRLSHINDNVNQNKQPDMPELLRMVTEKNSAWLQGSSALIDWQKSLLKQYWSQSPALWLAPPAASLGLSQLLATSARWTSLSLTGFSQVLKPYHAASTANARRLSRKSRSR